jgi:hypothetical protein
MTLRPSGTPSQSRGKMFGGVRIDTVTSAPIRTRSPARSIPLLPAPTTSTRQSLKVPSSRTSAACKSLPRGLIRRSKLGDGERRPNRSPRPHSSLRTNRPARALPSRHGAAARSAVRLLQAGYRGRERISPLQNERTQTSPLKLSRPRKTCGTRPDNNDVGSLRHQAILRRELARATDRRSGGAADGLLFAAGCYSPRQTGSRFSRNAVIPSCASCASAFSVMTSSQYS